MDQRLSVARHDRVAVTARPAFRFSASSQTVVVDDRDHVEWRKGRERFAVWLVDADLTPVRDRLAEARASLRDLLAPTRRQPHVTISVGGFLVDQHRFGDDFPLDRRRFVANALASAFIPPFALAVGGLDSFESAVFLTVDDPDGGLAALREVLCWGGDRRPEPYVPHVTVGTYRDVFSTCEVAARLSAFGDREPLLLPVSRIHLATYAAADIAGRLDFVETHELALAMEGSPGDRVGIASLPRSLP